MPQDSQSPVESPATRRSREFVSRYVRVIGVLFVFAFGVYLGGSLGDGRAQNILAATNSVTIDLLSSPWQNASQRQLFGTVHNLVQSKYVKGQVDESALFYGSLEGMVASLGDPYSQFFPPEQSKEFVSELEGAFDGIGAEIGKEETGIVVITPLVGSPAEKAGLKSGDAILKINDIDTAGFSVEQAVRKIRGPKGSVVALTIYRKGEKDTRVIKITRQRIDIPAVTWERRADGIVYVRIAQFNDQVVKEFEKMVSNVQSKKPKGIILDLRNNPGGFLDLAVTLSSEWLDQDAVVVKEKFRNPAQNKSFTANGMHRLRGIPTVILVNGGSASASEIMAGALQDHGKAKIIGTTTFGKGSVQDFEQFADQSSLKITVAEWLTPKDRAINDKGITPDIVSELPKTPVKKNGKEVDTQLERAVQFFLKGK